MRFAVSHDTFYRYSVPVGLAPHVLRLNPRLDGGRLLSRKLVIDPLPGRWIEAADPFGNEITQVEFIGTTQLLHIDSSFDLETAPAAMLQAIDLPGLPWPNQARDGLQDYRYLPTVETEVCDFAHAIAAQVAYAPLPFLDHLSRTLYERMDRHIRVEGAAQTAGQTLASWRGACRDVTVLFLAACRYLNMAGRFVSGYQAEADTPGEQRYLHAWPEVFLPGIGWRGWDPTHGIRVADGHVALCAAPEQADTMPIAGGFYANGVTATLDFRVRIATS